MKIFLTMLFSLVFLIAHTQSVKRTETPFGVVKKIFNDYVKYEEGIDSEENKEAMKKALQSLKNKVEEKDLQTLIDVWMYYDPTDFPTRDFAGPIFFKNKAISLKAVSWRLAHKKKWEDKDTAPYADLLALKMRLLKPAV